MKKEYMTPYIEIEEYQLDKSIALGCNPVIDLGPAVPGYKQCDKWKDDGDFGGDIPLSLYTSTQRTSFYENSLECGCDCKYTSGNTTYFKS